MKKILLVLLMLLVGISLTSFAFADEARTIPMKSGVAPHANTVIVGHGGTLYKVTGFASSANAGYSIHDATDTVKTSTSNVSPTRLNTLTEGGEATQYDSFDTIDFGPEGIAFNNGLVVITTTADVCVLYR